MPKNIHDNSILIVDDDHSVLSILEFILDQKGFHIYTAKTQKDCVKILQSKVPISLLFLDSNVSPKYKQFIESVHSKFPDIRVILMSKYQATPLLSSLYELGIFGILYKPFDIEEVISIVQKILKKQPTSLKS